MAGDRPIDLFRDGAVSAKSPDECGNIVAIFGCERQHRMYVLGQTGISSSVFADKIDPDRINPAIPNVVQKLELEYGATTEFVQQTVGMAMTIFKDKKYLPLGFDREDAFSEALSIAQELAEISDNIRELSRSEMTTREKFQFGMPNIGQLPKTQNLRGRSNQSIGHLASARSSTVRLAQMFYPKSDAKEGWSQSLKRVFETIFNEDDELRDDLVRAINYLRTVVDWRNTLEHPRLEQNVIFRDYELSPLGTITPPTIEIEHRTSGLPKQDLVQFLQDSVLSLGNVFEILISVCCDQNIKPFSHALTTRLVQLPNGQIVAGSRYIFQSQWKEGFPIMNTPSDIGSSD